VRIGRLLVVLGCRAINNSKFSDLRDRQIHVKQAISRKTKKKNIIKQHTVPHR
jgi:hypothetical protein